MGILSKIFTWWDGATIGTALFSWKNGEKVGTDAEGNTYFRSNQRHGDGRERRWVIYQGANDASRVPPEWHGWLHGSFGDGEDGGVPESNLPPARIWETDYTPNQTGTDLAYRPPGALEMGGKRAPARGDYEAWTPDS